VSLLDEVAEGLDGLSQLRALMASGRKPGILIALDFEFVEVEVGKAVFAGLPGNTIQLVLCMAAMLRRCLIPLAAAPFILVLPHRRPSRHWS
jgi:hypothetical protein